MLLVGYKSLTQPALLETILLIQDNSESKYKSSKLKQIDLDELSERIKTVISKSMCFKNNQLTLDEFSELTQIPAHQVSQVLNQKLQVNFYDFINSYRVQEVKNLFQDEKYLHYTILAIAYEAGFNSKNAFNNAFKKHTSMTPSAYRKSHIKNE